MVYQSAGTGLLKTKKLGTCDKRGNKMSEYRQFLEEKQKIDILIQKGYRINSIHEHLDGATVEFLHQSEKEMETIVIGNANARKYFSSLLIKLGV